MKRWLIHGLIIALILAAVTVFVGCSSPRYPPVEPGGQVPSVSFESNGQRIYFTATSSSGEAITPEGFTMMMHRIACVDCHGSAGKGGTVSMMMQSFDVPNITWPELTGREHEDEGEHENHPPYTEDTLKRAITQGLDPAGERLDEFMPKWRMSAQDLNDLVAFIKTLQ